MANETQTPTQTDAEKAAEKALKDYKQAENVGAGITGSIGELLDIAEDLDKEKDELLARISANRDMLRGFVTQKLATKDQAVDILTMYPIRERKPKGASNGS